MWRHAQEVIGKINKSVPISSIHLIGSFATKKRRPADVDVILLLKTKVGADAKWSVDMVIAPDNAHGEFILEDARKWMKQKYGAKKSSVLKLK